MRMLGCSGARTWQKSSQVLELPVQLWLRVRNMLYCWCGRGFRVGKVLYCWCSRGFRVGIVSYCWGSWGFRVGIVLYCWCSRGFRVGIVLTGGCGRGSLVEPGSLLVVSRLRKSSFRWFVKWHVVAVVHHNIRARFQVLIGLQVRYEP